MYNGKNTGMSSGEQAGGSRRRASKKTALILALVLLLGVTIGGTIAYLVRASDAVNNAFVPAKVKIDIQEKFEDNVKTEIIVKTFSSTDSTDKSNIPVYIRVALVGNWADADDKICINHTGDPPGDPLANLTLGENWKKGDDGFYYYTVPVAVGGSTTNLLGSSIELKSETDGCSYQLEVIASAIQAQGELDATGEAAVAAVYDAWRIDPSTLREEVQG